MSHSSELEIIRFIQEFRTPIFDEFFKFLDLFVQPFSHSSFNDYCAFCDPTILNNQKFYEDDPERPGCFGFFNSHFATATRKHRSSKRRVSKLQNGSGCCVDIIDGFMFHSVMNGLKRA